MSWVLAATRRRGATARRPEVRPPPYLPTSEDTSPDVGGATTPPPHTHLEPHTPRLVS